MTDRERRIEELARRVATMSTAECDAFLDAECGDDEALRREVEASLHGAETIQRSVIGSEEQATGDFAPGRAPAPERIGEYRVVRELGRGGMGVVYLGASVDDAISRHVAIKIVKRGMDTDEVVQRFDLERQLLSALNHPNVARIYGGGTTDDGRPYFVMEYIEGVRIDRWCDQNKLNVSERIELFETVCAAVQYAHQNLVVHRDLKPGNIIVTKEGVPKLLDFGIAKVINPALNPVRADPTAAGMRLMTPEYASPEQAQGLPLTTASDVYSLGVLLYELLTGHRPYRIEARLAAEIERIICTEEPERPSTAIARTEDVAVIEFPLPGEAETGTRTLTPDTVASTREGRPDKLRRRLTGDLDNIVMKALRKEPRHRYASAEQLREDLDRHLNGLPVEARGASFTYRFWKGVRRNRVPVAVAAVIALSLVAGLIGTLWQAGIAKEQAVIARASEREAVAQKDRAETALDKLRALTMELLEVERLMETEGTTSARRRLLDKAKPILEELSTAAGDDTGLQQDLARIYDRLGDLMGGRGQGNLGDLDEAMALYGKSLAIRDALNAAGALDTEAGRELAYEHKRIGDLHRTRGNANEALAAYETMLELSRKYEATRGEAVARMAIGDMHHWLGDPAAAETHHRLSVEIRRARLEQRESRPSDDGTRLKAMRDLARGLNGLAFTMRETARYDEAAALHREALDLTEAGLEQVPESPQTIKLALLTRTYLAEVELSRDDPRAAARLSNAALGAARAWYDADPSDVVRMVALIDSLGLEARVLAANARDDEARDRFAEALDLARTRLAEAADDDADARRLVAQGHAGLGLHLESTGDDPGAERHLESAANRLRPLVRDQERFRAQLDEVNAALERVRARRRRAELPAG